MISTNICWNSGKSKIEKGIYYVFTVGNRIYNILINEYVLKIDERTSIDFDDKSQKDNVTIERIIQYLKDRNEYNCTRFKHDKVASSFDIKWYPNDDNPILAVFGLPLEEAFSEVKSVISNLEGIEGVTSIVDLDLLKSVVLEDMKKKMEQDAKKI